MREEANPCGAWAGPHPLVCILLWSVVLLLSRWAEALVSSLAAAEMVLSVLPELCALLGGGKGNIWQLDAQARLVLDLAFSGFSS